ncbi:hypothetical protein OQH61_08155 [Helicobacter sp. MIT 21-1697]|uniref:hypothetical protein n=1 Tax=Helicobacter sp. MIT 21-1697 TaxID=2993733 RepID=UPI00224A797E|nr:hypothetical protein [Helicobacter sp. MIT 21-1697]MCX2717706.1 hypothetical protein [Helicobacter sp. MIT 21-1697]
MSSKENMMKNKRKFDEFYSDIEDKIISFNKLNKDNYLVYENQMFCPDCRKAKLSYVFNTKTPHLKSKSGGKNPPHQESCPYGYKPASNNSVRNHIDALNNTQIEHKLASMMRYLLTDKSIRQTFLSDDTGQNNPMLIEAVAGATRTYNTMRRKSLGAYFTEEDKGEIYVFYGKGNLKLNDKGNYAFLKIVIGGKTISVHRPKNLIPNDIEENAEYYIVCIGYLKDSLFKIELLKSNCLKYQRV